MAEFNTRQIKISYISFVWMGIEPTTCHVVVSDHIIKTFNKSTYIYKRHTQFTYIQHKPQYISHKTHTHKSKLNQSRSTTTTNAAPIPDIDPLFFWEAIRVMQAIPRRARPARINDVPYWKHNFFDLTHLHLHLPLCLCHRLCDVGWCFNYIK